LLTLFACSEACGSQAHMLSVARLCSPPRRRHKYMNDIMVRATYAVGNAASLVSYGVVTVYRLTLPSIAVANVATLTTAAAVYVVASVAAAAVQHWVIERSANPSVLSATVPRTSSPPPPRSRRQRTTPCVDRVTSSSWFRLALFHLAMTGANVANFHLWLTLPVYMIRHDRLSTTFGLFLDINPALVLVLTVLFSVAIARALERGGNVGRLLLAGSVLQATSFFWIVAFDGPWALVGTVVHFTLGETIGMPSAEMIPLRLGGTENRALFLGTPALYTLLVYVMNTYVSAALLNTYCPAAAAGASACLSSMWLWVMALSAVSPVLWTLIVWRRWIDI
jgi:hypothetical protein